MIQAWFVGAHADIGGGAKNDGLSLYPLQWMLSESQDLGLTLEHKRGELSSSLIEDPIELVFPSQSLGTEESMAVPVSQPWIYHYANGIRVKMWDLRTRHEYDVQQVPPENVVSPAGPSKTKRSSFSSIFRRGSSVNAPPLTTLGCHLRPQGLNH